MKQHLMLLLMLSVPVMAQSNAGELRLRVLDPAGLAAPATIVISSQGNQYRAAMRTDDAGRVVVSRLAYGIYQITVDRAGFTGLSRTVEVRSAIPASLDLRLEVAPLATTVSVDDAKTILDPYRPSASSQIGKQEIEQRLTSLPGRSLQDLVNSQPGWLYEGNAVLHPRGAEYQTQFVVDGIPLTDDRSPGFGPELEADDVDAMHIYTAGIPAEYGRKLGGVVEMDTRHETDAGTHGQIAFSGGSYDTAGGFAQVQRVWAGNTLGFSADGDQTAHYLNPVVPQNYTNRGTTGDFSANYERELTAQDRLSMAVRHALSRYQIPNELLEQQAGQLQHGDNFETLSTIRYQHIFSPDVLGSVAAMVRDGSTDLDSNETATPVIANQHNEYRQGYFKGTISIHHGRNEWKAGLESDATFLHENFSDLITDPAQFDDGTPASFAFRGERPDLEQAAFVEDLFRLGKWTVSAGLRYDHYQLLLNQHAFSPRLSVGRYLPSAQVVLHFSYDRVFQTPSSTNILLSSSPAVSSLNPSILRLPVKPSRGDYYEGGLTKNLFDKARLDVNVFRRFMRNYADDDQLLNTAVSFPIAFDKAIIYGAEGKLDLLHVGHLTGFVSYSYIVGNCWFPVTGGLFLGDDVSSALTRLTGHFPDSQDQRNTARLRLHYQVKPRVWLAGGTQYGSGLPFDYGGTLDEAVAQYGPDVVGRINFDRGRIKPHLDLNASAGVDVYRSEKVTSRLQVDGANLTNQLNVIDFGGLFSGNAIGPARSYSLRLTIDF